MSIAQKVAGEVKAGTGNAADLKIGQRVTHRLSQICGYVEEVAQVGDQTLLSVRTTKGKFLTKLNRQEFELGWSAPL